MTGLLGKFSREDWESGKDLPLRSKMVGHESTRRDTKMEMLLRNILSTDHTDMHGFISVLIGDIRGPVFFVPFRVFSWPTQSRRLYLHCGKKKGTPSQECLSKNIQQQLTFRQRWLF